MKTVTTLDQLFQQDLQDIYDAEKQLVKALPKLAKAASSDELEEAIREHLEATKGHVQRIEEIFESLGSKAKSSPCAGMKGLISEGQEIMEGNTSETLKDLAIIGAAQRVEHYEISAYGTARTFAQRLGHDEAVELLEQTLSEEREADEKLTQISESLMEQMPAETSSEEPAEPARTGAKASAGRAKVKRSGGGR